MKKEDFSVKGSFVGILHHKDGTATTIRKDNLILDAGMDFLCDAIGKGTNAVMGFIALGTGTTAAANGQTALGTELQRKAAAYSHTAGTYTLGYTSTFNVGEATGALTEAGICNASTAGIFLDRVVFPVINKGADDVFTANFTITFARA